MRAFSTLRPDLPRARRRSTGEVAGRLTESLGGVRVVKGYHAEARESSGVLGGRGAPARQHPADADRDVRPWALASTVLLGVVGAAVMYVGARQILAGHADRSAASSPTRCCSASWWRRIFQVVSIGTQLTEALAGLERTREVLREAPRGRGPAAHARPCGASRARSRSRTCTFAYEPGKPVLHGVSLPRASRARSPRSWARRARASPRSSACSPPSTRRRAGAVTRRRRRSLDRAPRHLPHAARASCCRRRSCSTARSARTSPSRGPDATEEQILEACRIARVDEFAERFAEATRRSWASAA